MLEGQEILRNHEMPGQISGKGPQRTVDMCIGTRIRLRRTMLGMSQERLGAQLGVTFQQVQKYERGTSRVGSSRLFEISRVLEVPVSYFFEEVEADGEDAVPVRRATAKAATVPPQAVDPTERRETFKLVRAYCRIQDPAIRRRVFDLVKAVSKGKAY